MFEPDKGENVWKTVIVNAFYTPYIGRQLNSANKCK